MINIICSYIYTVYIYTHVTSTDLWGGSPLMYIRRGRDSPPLRKGKRERGGKYKYIRRDREPSLDKKKEKREGCIYIYRRKQGHMPVY
jgi:hypothetical protein